MLTVRGKTQSLAAWAKETGHSKRSLEARRDAGWTDEQIVEKPRYGRVA
jgi:hypothetical protein